MSGDTVTKKMALTVGDVADRLQVSQPMVKIYSGKAQLWVGAVLMAGILPSAIYKNVLQAAVNIEANTWRRSLK